MLLPPGSSLYTVSSWNNAPFQSRGYTQSNNVWSKLNIANTLRKLYVLLLYLSDTLIHNWLTSHNYFIIYLPFSISKMPVSVAFVAKDCIPPATHFPAIYCKLLPWKYLIVVTTGSQTNITQLTLLFNIFYSWIFLEQIMIDPNKALQFIPIMIVN